MYIEVFILRTNSKILNLYVKKAANCLHLGIFRAQSSSKKPLGNLCHRISSFYTGFKYPKGQNTDASSFDCQVY